LVPIRSSAMADKDSCSDSSSSASSDSLEGILEVLDRAGFAVLDRAGFAWASLEGVLDVLDQAGFAGASLTMDEDELEAELEEELDAELPFKLEDELPFLGDLRVRLCGCWADILGSGECMITARDSGNLPSRFLGLEQRHAWVEMASSKGSG
jgi:hypothetical protein